MLIRVFSHKGSNVATSQEQAQAVAETLLENRSEWWEQLAGNPDSLRDVERDVDQQVRTAGGQFVAALLQEASETPAFEEHVDRVRQQAVVPTKAPVPTGPNSGCCVESFCTSARCPAHPNHRAEKIPAEPTQNNEPDCVPNWPP